MIAMILAAGRGERLRPLTDTCPKPLISVSGKPLIVYTIEKLKESGFTNLIINTAWLGEQIAERLGNGDAFGVSIRYSHEKLRFGSNLETAGGIRGMLFPDVTDPFLVVNGDVICDFDFKNAFSMADELRKSHDLANLVLINNPSHHPNGDFILSNTRITNVAESVSSPFSTLTFSGIGVYAPSLFSDIALGTRVKLLDVLKPAIKANQVAGVHHSGFWLDVGTPERLQQAAHYFGEITV